MFSQILPLCRQSIAVIVGFKHKLNQSQNKKGRKIVLTAQKWWGFFTAGSWEKDTIFGAAMEDGGVDTSIIESSQQKMGQMAEFPPLLASSVFDP